MLRKILRRVVMGPSVAKRSKLDLARGLIGAKQYVLLHVGKTGGTSLRGAISKMQSDGIDLPLVKLPHDVLLKDVRSVAPIAKIGFVYRDPMDRFVSAFDCRLRNGRPEYNVLWAPGEAAAFLYFQTANDLAEALSSSDQRLRSAAAFAMRTITHVRKGYEYCFGSLEELAANKDRIFFMCDLKDLDDRVYECFAPFNISSDTVDKYLKRRNKGTPDKTPLSDLAQRNLRAHWETEFLFYEEFKRLDKARV
jgi:hypothetical protein